MALIQRLLGVADKAERSWHDPLPRDVGTRTALMDRRTQQHRLLADAIPIMREAAKMLSAPE